MAKRAMAAQMEMPPGVEDLKAELFRRGVPLKYRGLVRSHPFHEIPTGFSYGLKSAVSRANCDVGEFYDGILSDFGNELKKAVAGRDFIDLGCGNESGSVVPRAIAQHFGARRYVGVDKHYQQERLEIDLSLNQQHCPVYYVCDDMLSFVSKLGESAGRVFHVGGIEPYYRYAGAFRHGEKERQKMHDPSIRYIDALLREMSRATKPGDAIVIGDGTWDFEPNKYGFGLASEIRRAGLPVHELYVKMRN